MSNETKHDVNHRVSALDPLADASHYGRHRPWDIEGRAPNIALAVLVVLLYGTLVLAERRSGYVIMLLVGLFAAGMPVLHMRGGTLRRDRQVRRRLLLRLDTLGARRARGLHLHPLGARTVESATGPATVVQQPEHEKARFGGSLPPAARMTGNPSIIR